jgi:hypothetical protein
MVFNIGSQTGGVINNVEGDQHIRGGQQGQIMSTEALRHAVRDLRAAIDAGEFDAATYESLSTHVEEIEREVRHEEPDRARVAGPLQKISETIVAAGAIANLAGPVQAIVSWLGTLGQPIAQLFASIG